MNSILIVVDSNNRHEVFIVNNSLTKIDFLEFIYKERWYLKLSNNYLFDDNTKIKVLDGTCYKIITDSYQFINLYVYYSFDGYSNYLLIDRQNLYISSDLDSSIIIKDINFIGYYLKIVDGILETNFDGLYVNNHRTKTQELHDNDLIAFLGIKIYFFNSFYYVNCFQNENKAILYKIRKTKIKYFPNIVTHNHDIYRVQKSIEYQELKPFSVVRKREKIDFFQLSQGMIMTFSMLFMVLMNDGDISLKSFVMPMAFFISTTILPFISQLIEMNKERIIYQNKLNDYISYIDDYYEKLKLMIQDYSRNEQLYLFDINNYKRNRFIISKKDNHYLTISLGTKELDCLPEIKETNNEDINNKLNEILLYLKSIRIPYFIHLNHFQSLSIFANKKLLSSLFESILIQLITRFSSDDIKIAIFCHDESVFVNMANVNHFFLNNERLFFNDECELNSFINSNHEITCVVLALDYFFFNNNSLFSVIYLLDDLSSHNNSELSIEIKGDKGFVDDIETFKYLDIKYQMNDVMRFVYLNSINNDNKSTSFNEYFDISKEAIKANYERNYSGLLANFAYADNKIFGLDLHENKQGPHGLVGGTTGSGKSELLVSLILSLAYRYSPNNLNIVIFDYKGGGILSSLSFNKKLLPHIIASIDDLDETSYERLKYKLMIERNKRERLFKELSNKSMEPITNLDEYSKIAKKYGFPAIAQLLIIIDEFAELKKTHNDFIKEVISLARIGRSLGFHLVLSTQKPGGAIDDEIWSNSKFKIALKVNDENDSKEIIKDPKAAYLKKPGDFYLLADNTIKARSFYWKNDYQDNDNYEVSLLDAKHQLIDKTVIQTKDKITAAQYLIKNIIELDYCVDRWILNTPFNKSINQLKNEYSIPLDKYVVGESDDYKSEIKKAIFYDYCDSQLLILPELDFLNNIIMQFINKNYYAIYIGKACSFNIERYDYDDTDDIKLLFAKLIYEKDKEVCLIIENTSRLINYDDDYLSGLLKIKNLNEKVTMLLCFKDFNIPFRLIEYFEHKLVYDFNNYDDLSIVFGSKTQYVGKYFYYDTQPKPFIPCANEKPPYFIYDKEDYLFKIPNIIKWEPYLIGYNTLSREKIYSHNNILITSFDNEVLNEVKKYYKSDNIEIRLYSNQLIQNDYDTIIWLKNGLNSQKLFFPNRNILDKDYDSICIEGNTQFPIRLINHE